MENFIVRESQGKVIFKVLVNVFLFIASLLTLYYSAISGSTIFMMFGLLGIVYFGYITFYVIRRGVKSASDSVDGFLIKVDKEGVTDRSNLMSIGFIPWSEIKSVTVTPVFGQKLVSLHLRDPKGFFNDLGNNGNQLAKLYGNMRHAPVNLNVQTSKTSADELISVIKGRIR